ncbi:hypothetical protein HMPREF1427_00343 [Helicobacter pylori GAM83Bi]|uniref:hypothetical protein n=1 Tax=Helicobacter pylori TaxID=210 RepID=UPI0002BA779B|nr:hypothetical protein [Helicobacter pylori]EMH38901.1 hypothetical protein HMPREF1427_00343 [Helicobacter pylori GAM83Bi]EMH39022.1 hypothetical protein HMPREF1428_00893 [Helicobacter pylori GAM83T]
MKKKPSSYYNEDTGRCYSGQTGKRLHGCAEYNAKAKHLNGGLKQTLDQNEELKDENRGLKKALFYSLSLIHEQDKQIHEQGKQIQHQKNVLGSVLSALNLDIPSLDFNEK